MDKISSFGDNKNRFFPKGERNMGIYSVNKDIFCYRPKDSYE